MTDEKIRDRDPDDPSFAQPERPQPTETAKPPVRTPAFDEFAPERDDDGTGLSE